MDLTDHGWSGFTLNIASGHKLVFRPELGESVRHRARGACGVRRRTVGGG